MGIASSDLAVMKAEFDERGFVLLKDFFDAELMDRVDAAVRHHFGDVPQFQHSDEFITLSRAEIIPWFPQRDPQSAPLFDEVDAYPGLATVTEALLGPGWSNLFSMAMHSRQGSAGQPWHQDCPPEHASRFNLNRLIYCSPITAEIGGEVAVIPGSHRLGEVPRGLASDDLPNELVLRPGKGHLLLLHGHCWHRVLPVHGGTRHSVNHRAGPIGVEAGITDICVYRNMRYRFSTAEVLIDRLAQ